MSDKYREMAETLDLKVKQGLSAEGVRILAAFGRSCAAEAYKHAAKLARDVGDITNKNKNDERSIGQTKAAYFVANLYDRESAAPRGKGGADGK